MTARIPRGHSICKVYTLNPQVMLMQETTPGQTMGREDSNASSHHKQVPGFSAKNLEQNSGLGSRNPSEIDFSQACPCPLGSLHPDTAHLISLKPETELNRMHPSFSATALLALRVSSVFLWTANPVHCRMFSTMPRLNSLDASGTLSPSPVVTTTKKYLQTLQNVPQKTKSSPRLRINKVHVAPNQMRRPCRVYNEPVLLSDCICDGGKP